MRARQPDIEGFVDHDGVKVGYSVYARAGSDPTADDPTVVLAPAWLVVDSRVWKAQVPYLARYFRVITVEPRGNGRADRPLDPAAYSDDAQAGDLVAALDAVGVRQAVFVGLSGGAFRAVIAASRYPERAVGVVAIAPSIPLLDISATREGYDFEAVRPSYAGWQRYNRHYWRDHYPDFLAWYFDLLFSEPHSTKQIEDCVAWGLGTTAEVVTVDADAPPVGDRATVEALVRAVRCPVLVIHGDADRCIPYPVGERLAELTGGRLIRVDGAGHVPTTRHPVPVNLWIREFVESLYGPGPVAPQRVQQPREQPPREQAPREQAAPVVRWRRALNRPRRVLYLSSPIGLGHGRRDLAIARELRLRHPDVEIDWLAQHPVTTLLAAAGERVHPASGWLSSESGHIEAEAGEHDLHAFQAIRRMDEILVANFMVFHDVVTGGGYDLWIGDESWDVDFFLHENPELKRAAYAWCTDFVGWLPMPSGGDAEAAITADYNAEMIEHIARFPRVRDRALFVGDPEDVVPASFGPGLPDIPAWTGEHFAFTGYVTGFAPAEIADRDTVRERAGWRPDERVCLVTVGGTGVGAHLVRRALAAYPLARRLVPELRMVVVTGPRLDPDSLSVPAGVDVLRYLPDLHRYLAAADLAVVQGGLTTTMELTAAARPFLYVPLDNHFEQQYHVPHRLARYGAGRRVDFADTQPERLARAIAEEIGRPVRYRPVDSGGAARAAAALAELL